MKKMETLIDKRALRLEQERKQKEANQPLTYATDLNDELYLKEIEKYKDKPYYESLLRNPWLRSKHSRYQPGLFEFSSQGSTAYYEGLQSNQAQWLADTLARYEQQEYNSPSEQVQREQAAGLNPDLTGNITPGEAAENDQPLQESPMVAAQQIGKEFCNQALQVIGGVLNFAQTMQGLSAGAMNGVINELSANGAAKQFALEDIVGTLKTNPDAWKKGLTKEQLANLLPPAEKVDRLPFSHYTRKLLTRYYNKYRDKDSVDYEKLYARVRKEILEDNEKSVGIAGNPLYSPEFKEWMQNYSQQIGKTNLELQKASMIAQYYGAIYEANYNKAKDGNEAAGAENAQNGYTQDYYSALDAETAAGAENAGAEAKTAEAKYHKEYFEGLDAKEAAHAANLLATKEGFQYYCESLIQQTYANIMKDWENGEHWWDNIAIMEFQPMMQGISNLMESLPSKLADVGLEYLTPENTKGNKKEKSGNGLGAGDMAILSKLAKTKVDGKTLAKIAGAVAKKAL